MSTPIKINKGLKENLPEILDGQINFCTDTGELYIDNGETRTIISSTYYGESKTGGSVTTKEATIDGFSLKPGVRVIIKFTNNNTASSNLLSLNINNTGKKYIVYGGTDELELLQGVLYDFVYNGTNYILIGNSASGENVLQIENTTNFEYPLLASNIKADVSIGNHYKPTIYNPEIKMNPSTGTITATNFNGIATNATNDEDGNEITTTYATKEELSNMASVIIRRWTE